MEEGQKDEVRRELRLGASIAQARKRLLKRWLLNLDLGHGPPDDLTFSEIHRALDEVVKRVEECRVLYPHRPPANTTESIIRSMPPALRDSCCNNEKRNMQGGCDSCGDPCL